MDQPSQSLLKGRKFKGGASAILEAAERLYGQHGLDGVSIRQITLAAGTANNSAVTYHFGDRDGLVQAICEWRLPDLEEQGTALFEQAEAEAKLGDPEAMIGVLLLPFARVLDADGRHTHAAFMHQLMRAPKERMMRFATIAAHSSAEHALNNLEAILPGMPRSIILFRLRLAALTFFDSLVELDRERIDPDIHVFSEPEMLAEVIRLVTAMVTSPIAE